ncbi:beta-1 adrenergic receptor-like [Centruroides vittatus]|uniref:beta-1 adrenergic receptor-like n=1 Tax=Centruroides vittatus TaxID=120091 RepID=UPI00350EB259
MKNTSLPPDWTDSNSTFMHHGLPVIVPLSIVMVIIIILAIGGNIMVILTICRHRGMRTRTNIFIVNLAAADILIAVFNMPLSLVTLISGDWVFGKGMCLFNGFTMALFLICSIHTLMYISIHKYISITKPFSRAMNPRRIKIMIAATWIWSCICATAPLLGLNRIIYKKGSSQCGPSYPDDVGDYAHSFIITTTNYIIPLGVMTFCYFHIFREIHEHMKRIRETSNINLESSVSQQKRISITLFFVLACFLICWTPFVLYSTSVAIMKNKTMMPLVVNPIVYWCGYLNSACNPIIYAFRSPSFRQGYKEIMCGTYQGPILSAGSSVRTMSFRSRSLRTSNKSHRTFSDRFTLRKWRSKKKKDIIPAKTLPNRKRFLSQTSWISLPCLPMGLKRVITTSVKENNEKRNNPPEKSPNLEETVSNNQQKLSPVAVKRLSVSCPSLKETENGTTVQESSENCTDEDLKEVTPTIGNGSVITENTDVEINICSESSF